MLPGGCLVLLLLLRRVVLVPCLPRRRQGALLRGRRAPIMIRAGRAVFPIAVPGACRCPPNLCVTARARTAFLDCRRGSAPHKVGGGAGVTGGQASRVRVGAFGRARGGRGGARARATLRRAKHTGERRRRVARRDGWARSYRSVRVLLRRLPRHPRGGIGVRHVCAREVGGRREGDGPPSRSSSNFRRLRQEGLLLLLKSQIVRMCA